jgi:hypothetical protein
MSNDVVRTRAAALLLNSLFLCNTVTNAKAWQVDGFYSGMTVDEVAGKLRAEGINDLVTAPVSGKHAVTVLQSRRLKNSVHFTFCGNNLYEISKDYKGGLHEFASEVGIESRVRGAAATEVFENGGLALVISRWHQNAEYFEMILESDLSQQFSFAKSYGDSSIKSNCESADQ